MCENVYITPAGQESLKTFKYKGGSDSLLYELLWAPLSQFIVDKILSPQIAPNLITFTGFIGICISSAVIQYHSWNYSTDLPSWTLYLASFAILFYQILDNVDGKQARKTGSSSPLGMLFDHGCDTTTTWIIGLMISNCLQLGNSQLMCFGLLGMAFLGFFFEMWFQYHIGFVRLSRINAIDEGLFIRIIPGLVFVELMFFFSAVFGQSMWHTKIFLIGITLNNFVILTCIFGCIIQCFQLFKTVVTEKSLFTAISSLCVPMMIVTVFFITYFYSPTQAFGQYGYLYIYGFGFMWSKMVGHLQLCHIVNEKYFQFEPMWVTICTIQTLNVIFGYHYGQCIINELLLIKIIILVSFIFYAHFCVCVALHISKILNIGIFTIKKQVSATYNLPHQFNGGHKLEEIEIQSTN